MTRVLWSLLFSGTTTLPALAQGIHWIEDFQAGLAKAKAEGKPIFLGFYAAW